MGFFSPKLPPFDVHIWYWGRRSERFKPMCQHWGEHGFGTPWGVHLIHLIKIALYVAGGAAFILNTPGIGSLNDVATWWTDPVVYQKAVLWSLLFEVLGFGCGSGPLTMRFLPPFGGLLHWLRPDTIRLPPWPSRIPLTNGTRRTVFDVLLYAALLTSLLWTLLSPAVQPDLDLNGQVGVLEPSHLLPFAVLLPLLGLRDKTIFLAARSEYYWLIALAFFMPFLDMVVTFKILAVLVWWSAAVSKLNKMFPYTVAAMFSNTPFLPKFLRRLMFRKFPADMRPSAATRATAYLGVFIEFAVPLVLLISTDRWMTIGAVVLMMLFHLNVLVAMPFGGPLEWNVFVIFSTCYLFYGHFANDMSTTLHPLAPALLAIPVVAIVTWGNLRPDQVSFLMSIRYYAGNWSTSMWTLNRAAVTKMNDNVVKSSMFPKQQLKRLYGEQVGELMAHKVYVWRSLHHHGRALFGLLPRAAGPLHERAIVADGELIAGTLLGWNFGDGHLHNEQLISALQERCNFEPGELRVVALESAAFGSDRQEYRLIDGAIGTFERGYVLVKDMIDRQPWEIDDLPAYVLRRLTEVPGDEATAPGPTHETAATGSPRIAPGDGSATVAAESGDQVTERVTDAVRETEPVTVSIGAASIGAPSINAAPIDTVLINNCGDTGPDSIGPQEFRPLGVEAPAEGPTAQAPHIPTPKKTSESRWSIGRVGSV
jgi:Transmembrane protein of unknown function (DUF3556)